MTTILFLFIGVLFALILLFYPNIATWTMLIMAMVIAGTITYFLPQFAIIRWGVVPISLALLLRAVLNFITVTPESEKVALPFYFFAFSSLILLICLSTMVNFQIKETLIASKNFFQFWSIPLAFVYVIKSKQSVSKIIFGLLCIAAIEPLLAIIQYLFFTGHFPGDSVTGTFGGKIEGGGPNAALSIYMTVQIVTVLAMLKKDLLKKYFAILLILWFSVPILLSHAKMTAIYFPIIFFVIYGKDFFKKPIAGLMILFILASLGTGVFYYHYSQSGQYRASGEKTSSFQAYINQILHYNIVDKHRDKKLSRVASISFWWQENSFVKYPVQTLIGHGLGAAKQSGLIWGHIASKSKYREYEIGRFALPRLLWDLGLIGTALYILIYISGFFAAGRLKNNPSIPLSQQAFLTGAQFACLLFLLSLPYKLSIINVQAFSAYSMFILGYIAFWEVEIRRQKINI